MKYTPPLNEQEDASYVNGDPSTGLTGSIIPAGALENPQREIVNVITSAGLTPSASINSQLAQAISTLISNSASAIQTQVNGKQATVTGAATTITGSNLTASRALIANSSGKVDVSSTTNTELGYVHGVTSAIQTQLNNKQTASDVSTAITNMLKSLYPVGSIYVGTQSTCPLATLISGSTWNLVAQNKALWGGDGSNANTTIAAGLPNIWGRVGFIKQEGNPTVREQSGAFYWGGESSNTYTQGDATGTSKLDFIDFNAQTYNNIYGNSNTVQPPAYRVNVWRRTK